MWDSGEEREDSGGERGESEIVGKKGREWDSGEERERVGDSGEERGRKGTVWDSGEEREKDSRLGYTDHTG